GLKFGTTMEAGNSGPKMPVNDDLPSPANSWASLPLPGVDRISYHLFNPEDCSDMVSKHYLSGVATFVNRDGNRPGVKAVHLRKREV
ncbi:hypothetical protein PMAYCL1PPCAC_26488, partial [Pristionchus mayeri]